VFKSARLASQQVHLRRT